MSVEAMPHKQPPLQPKDLLAHDGPGAARRIMELYGGRKIPRLTKPRVSREARNQEIIDFYFESHSDLDATAERFDLHPRHVQRIVNGR